AFGLCLLSLIVSFGLEALRPWLLREVIDGPIAQSKRREAIDLQLVYWLGACFLASTLLSVGIGYAYSMTTTRNGQRVIRDVRNRLFRHALHLSPRFFDRNPAGKLVTRVTSDVENLNELISTGVLHTIFDLLKIAGLLFLMFWIDVRLALFTVAAIPVVLIVSLLFKQYARASFRAVRGAIGRQNGFVAEAVGGVSSTRIFGQEEVVQAHFDELNQGTKSSWLRAVFQFALFISLVDWCIHITQAGMLWLGGTLILDGELSYGVFFQFWMYFSMLTAPVKELGEKYNVLQSAFASSERIFRILDEAQDPEQGPGASQSQRGPATLKVCNLTFAYKDGMEVLRDVSLEARPGTTTAIVGATGAGKSTLLSMLSRLQDPDAGRVLLDGEDLRDLAIESLRRRIAVVPQDVFLFTGSILENVRLFDESIPEARVAEALSMVGAMEFVERLPDGIHSDVQERGATFSQGEKQLLSFARALATEPDVLILDEATASIDSESEARIQKALKLVLRGRTCLVVAHRLSTVRDADQILVMADGRIVERGGHQDLLVQEGAYAKMVQQVVG
ncbi:MAG: ABC transporter ATP-binding protein, partial [Planctomycetota bacterium]